MCHREKGKPLGPKGKGKRHNMMFKVHSHLSAALPAGTNETTCFPGHRGDAMAALTPPNLPYTEDHFPGCT
jgi:hypothetical protein